MRRGGAAGVRVSRAVPARLPDRPGRLPALRPQRRRRAGVHAAADVPEDRGAPDRARDLGAARWSSAASIDAAGRRRAASKTYLDELQEALDDAAAGAGLRRADARDAAARRGRAGRRPRVPLERLRELNAALLTRARRLHDPSQARTRPREARAGARRSQTSARSTGRPPRSWRFASILADGISIRLTGEDVERGTFSHRHAVFHDADDRAACTCRCRRCRRRARRSRSTTARSPRTRVIGFEYGYNIQEPSRLVIWEAQYGDFINGAQVMHRRVHRLGARASGGCGRRWCCCCRTATKARARTTRARGPSASCSWPPTSTCASPTARPRRSTSTCCGGRRRCSRSIRCRSSC